MAVLLSIIVVFQSVAILHSAPLSACVDQQQCFQLIQGSQEGLATLKFMYSSPTCCALKNGQIDANGICTAGTDGDLFTDRPITDCGTSQPYLTFIAKDGSTCDSAPTNPISISGSSEAPLLTATCYLNPEGCNTKQNCEDRVGGIWDNEQCFCSQDECTNPMDTTVCLNRCNFEGKQGPSSTAECDVSCLCHDGNMEPKACAWNISIPTSWCPDVHSEQLPNNIPVVDLEQLENRVKSVDRIEWIIIGVVTLCIIGCVLETYWLYRKEKRKRLIIQQQNHNVVTIDPTIKENSYSTF